MDKVHINEVAIDIEDNGIGYAIEDYHGREIETDDKKLRELWQEAYDSLQRLREYIADNQDDEYEPIKNQ